MPVDLTKLPRPLPALKKFSWWFWAILLLVLIVTGCLVTFIISFFYSLSNLLLMLGAIVIPSCVWLLSLLYGIYYRGYREEYIKQWNIHRDKRRQHLIDYARRGLYVLQHAIVTSYGERGNGKAIANGEYAIATKPLTGGSRPIAHSALPLPDNIARTDYYDRLNAILMAWQTEYTLLQTMFSIDVNIHVRLFVDADLEND